MPEINARLIFNRFFLSIHPQTCIRPIHMSFLAE
jgi:hypothetical protein